MNTISTNIALSDASIQEVVDICQTVRTKNSQNEISVNMAGGIKDWVTDNGFVTERQAAWVARNADFYKIARPAELATICWETAKKQLQHIAANDNERPATKPEANPDTLTKILCAVRQIERLLAQR